MSQAIAGVCRSRRPCKFLSVFAFFQGYNSTILARKWGWGVGGSLLAPRQIQRIQELCMDAQATVTKSENPQPCQREGRNTWIFTCYAICGIVFFGVMAYYAAMYFAH
jgi:hypothetical protein